MSGLQCGGGGAHSKTWLSAHCKWGLHRVKCRGGRDAGIQGVGVSGEGLGRTCLDLLEEGQVLVHQGGEEQPGKTEVEPGQ